MPVGIWVAWLVFVPATLSFTVDATLFAPGETTPAATPAAIKGTRRKRRVHAGDGDGLASVDREGDGEAATDNGRVDHVLVTGLKHPALCVIVTTTTGPPAATETRGSAEGEREEGGVARAHRCAWRIPPVVMWLGRRGT